MLADEQKHSNISQQVEALHHSLRRMHPAIARLAIALYDAPSGRVTTYTSSNIGHNPLINYEAPLAEVPSLLAISHSRKPRVINDLGLLNLDSTHTSVIWHAGFRSSYTAPLYADDRLLGFAFFNGYEADVFHEVLCLDLDIASHYLALLVAIHLNKAENFLATVHAAQFFTHERDPETGEHLQRVARFSRLIAKGVARKFSLNDEFIEDVFELAPLHDIGKVAIADSILLKPDRLSQDERRRMERHTTEGARIIKQLVKLYHFELFSQTQMMIDIVRHHHEAWDGSGYPDQLSGEQIPIAARIVSVADVFDALTSQRSYKQAWNNQQAYEFLQQHSGVKFDPDCVAALLANRLEVENIQRLFADKHLSS